MLNTFDIAEAAVVFKAVSFTEISFVSQPSSYAEITSLYAQKSESIPLFLSLAKTAFDEKSINAEINTIVNFFMKLPPNIIILFYKNT